MANTRQTTPTNRGNLIAASVTAFIVVVFGVLLLLAGLGVLRLELARFWWPATAAAIWLSATATGVLRKETWLIWIGGVFLGLAIAYIADWATELGAIKLYPFYVAVPAVASLMALPFAQNKSFHLKVIIFFGGLTTLLAIHVAVEMFWLLTAGIGVIMAGLFMFINVATSKRGRWDDGDRPQRKRPD